MDPYRIHGLLFTLSAKVDLPHDDPTLGLFILKCEKAARELNKSRKVGYQGQGDHPFAILNTIAPYIEFPPGTPAPQRLERVQKIIAAAILYPLLRPHELEGGLVPDHDFVQREKTHFGTVEKEFAAVPGVMDLIHDVLRIREVNWMARIAGRQQNIPEAFLKAEDSADMAKTFRRIVYDATRDPDALLLRLGRFLRHMQMHDDNPDYSNQNLFMLNNFYIPVAVALENRDLLDDLRDEYFRRTNPEAYGVIKARITDVENTFLKNMGQAPIEDDEERHRAVCTLAVTRIEQAMPTELRGWCSTEGRVKTPYSLHDKERRRRAEGRDFHDDDIIGVRVIVNQHMDERDNSWCSRVHKGVKKALAGAGIRPVEGKEDNYMGSNAKGAYEALHCTYAVLPPPEPPKSSLMAWWAAKAVTTEKTEALSCVFEVQVVGAQQHWVNTKGEAAHGGYQGYAEAMELNGGHLSVYVASARDAFDFVVLRVPAFVGDQPMTPRLLAAYVDPGLSAKVSDAVVHKTSIDEILRPSTVDDPLDEILATGDIITYVYNTSPLEARHVPRPATP